MVLGCGLFNSDYKFFLHRDSTTVDLQNDQSFRDFGTVETSEYGAFRGSFPHAHLLFSQRWIDYAWFPSHATAQIVKLLLHDYFADQSLHIGA